MNILAINGSGRPGANTAHLLQALLDGAAEAGHETAMLELASMKITPCTACRRCKDSLVCALSDDMTRFYDQAASVDLLVLGSPIYLGHITGNMMTFIHRLYCYLDSAIQGHYPNPAARVVTAVTYGAPGEELYDGPLDYMGSTLDRYFGLERAASFKLPGVPRGQQVGGDHPIMRAARDFGRNL